MSLDYLTEYVPDLGSFFLNKPLCALDGLNKPFVFEPSYDEGFEQLHRHGLEIARGDGVDLGDELVKGDLPAVIETVRAGEPEDPGTTPGSWCRRCDCPPPTCPPHYGRCR